MLVNKHIERSERIYLLVDHSKVSVHVLEVVAALDRLDGLITGRAPSEPLAHRLYKAGVSVLVAPDESATTGLAMPGTGAPEHRMTP